MGSAVRVIVNTGRVRWNVSQFVRDPDTGKHKRRARPRADWIEHRGESLRIISEDMFGRARARTRVVGNRDERLKTGGKAKYLLSGLFVCDVCGANYVIVDARSYACSGHWNGGACANRIRVRRDAVEAKILGPIREDLLSPQRVERMAAEMQTLLMERLQNYNARAAGLPHEIQELEARIERLRRPLKAGDPDMAPDELQAAIDLAETKTSRTTERFSGMEGEH